MNKKEKSFLLIHYISIRQLRQKTLKKSLGQNYLKFFLDVDSFCFTIFENDESLYLWKQILFS